MIGVLRLVTSGVVDGGAYGDQKTTDGKSGRTSKGEGDSAGTNQSGRNPERAVLPCHQQETAF